MRSIKSLGDLTRGRGMIESVRNLWVATLHSCGEIEQTIRTVTETNRQTSEQHVELGVSRCRRDHADLMKVYEWLQQFNPFDTGDNRLRSLTSGLAAKDGDGMNCDRAEVVGRSLQENLDNLSMDEAKVPSSKTMQNLLLLTKGVEVNNKTIHVDPTVLFYASDCYY